MKTGNNFFDLLLDRLEKIKNAVSSGGGGTVKWFPSIAERDAYYTAHPAELKSGISCGVGDPVTAYTFDGLQWVEGAFAFRGPPGPEGPGASPDRITTPIIIDQNSLAETETGSGSAPFKTITAAVTSLLTGDPVTAGKSKDAVIYNGDYTGEGTLSLPPALSHIHIRGIAGGWNYKTILGNIISDADDSDLQDCRVNNIEFKAGHNTSAGRPSIRNIQIMGTDITFRSNAFIQDCAFDSPSPVVFTLDGTGQPITIYFLGNAMPDFYTWQVLGDPSKITLEFKGNIRLRRGSFPPDIKVIDFDERVGQTWVIGTESTSEANEQPYTAADCDCLLPDDPAAAAEKLQAFFSRRGPNTIGVQLSGTENE